MASGQCSFPAVRILEELIATVTTCVKKYGMLRLFLLACGLCEFTSKLSLGSIFLDLSRSYHFDCISQLI